MRQRVIGIALTALLALPAFLSATVIYENPWNSSAADAGAFAQADQRLAAELILASPASVVRATWYGTMFSADPLDTGDTWSFDIYFRLDSAGLPGVTYGSASVSAFVTDTGIDIGSERAYLFDATFAAVGLAAGTSYWFSVENTGIQNTFRWTEATSGLASAVSFSGNPWIPLTEAPRTPLNFALHDDGAPIPEPTTLVLLGAGLIALVRVERRRRHM